MFFFFLFFFPFGFTCIFKTSRGIATFRTSDTRGLYTKQHLTGADRAMMFPCKGLSERQSKNMRSSCTSAKETTRRGAFPPQESRSLSPRQPTLNLSWVWVCKPALPPKTQPMEEAETILWVLSPAQAYSTALRSQDFLGITFYFCPRATFLVLYTVANIT